MGDKDREAWAKLELEEALGAEALLLGRRSDEWFGARWLSRSGEWADRLNSLLKYESLGGQEEGAASVGCAEARRTVVARSRVAQVRRAAGAVAPLGHVEERLPGLVDCNIHPWMKGYLLVRDNPYMAVTGNDGSFLIANLPAGEWEFQAWHERSGFVDIGDWRRGHVLICTLLALHLVVLAGLDLVPGRGDAATAGGTGAVAFAQAPP